MFLWRKLENERDDATSAGLVDYLPEYWGIQVNLSSAELRFFLFCPKIPRPTWAPHFLGGPGRLIPTESFSAWLRQDPLFDVVFHAAGARRGATFT